MLDKPPGKLLGPLCPECGNDTWTFESYVDAGTGPEPGTLALNLIIRCAGCSYRATATD